MKKVIPFNWYLASIGYKALEKEYKMKKYIIGGLFAILINYCIGSTYLLEEGEIMWELTEQMLIQFIQCIPVAFGVYLIFNFTRILLFKE